MLEHVRRLAQAPPERGLRLYRKFTAAPGFTAWREFPARTAACAGFFRDHGITPGSRVLVPFETSAEAVFAFLALIQIGAVPLSVRLPGMTGRRACEDFLARVAREFRVSRVLAVPGLDGIRVPAAPLPLPPAGLRDPGGRLRVPEDGEIAFVQFSSGSTSFPKGIPVRHGQLRANLSMILRTDGRRPEERISSWLPLYHDMGLVGGLLSCLAAGGDLLLAPPEAFLADPLGWWQHMAAEHVAGTVMPGFAVGYSLRLMSGLAPAEIAEMDLSRLRSAYLGADPVSIASLEAFGNLMKPAGLREDLFMPCYGMAEAVLLVSSRPPGSPVRIVPSPAGVPALSVGAPMPGFRVRLRGEHGKLCGDHELGEIELAGGTLAASYFNGAPVAGTGGWYRTGDIGFTDGGELFVTGRTGDRIKVGAQSYFAADFEGALEQLPFIRSAAVFQHDGRIIVLAEAARAALEDAAGSRDRIAGHLLAATGVTVRAADIRYVRAGQLRRTSSGKLQRQAIAEAYGQGRIRFREPGSS